MGVEGVNNAITFDEAVDQLRRAAADWRENNRQFLGVRAKQFAELAYENQDLKKMLAEFLARGGAKPTSAMVDRAQLVLGRPFMRGLNISESYDLPIGDGAWLHIEPKEASTVTAYSVDRATWELAESAGMGALAAQWRGLWIIAEDHAEPAELEAGDD